MVDEDGICSVKVELKMVDEVDVVFEDDGVQYDISRLSSNESIQINM